MEQWHKKLLEEHSFNPRSQNQEFSEAGSYRSSCSLMSIYAYECMKLFGEFKMQLKMAIFSTARSVAHCCFFLFGNPLVCVDPDQGTD